MTKAMLNPWSLQVKEDALRGLRVKEEAVLRRSRSSPLVMTGSRRMNPEPVKKQQGKEEILRTTRQELHVYSARKGRRRAHCRRKLR